MKSRNYYPKFIVTFVCMSKHIIITGASRGIGFALVKQLSQSHRVLAVSRHPEKLQTLDNVHTVSMDFLNDKDFDKLLPAINQYLDGKVDIVIHNAGLLINKPFLSLSSQDFVKLYQVNVFAVAEITRLLLPVIRDNGHVVNISSMGGVQGSMKFPGLSAYSSSKGALITLTEVLAEEFKEERIAFNVLALGAVQTEMLQEAFPDFKAPVTPEEMAAFIGHFALTGQQFFNGKLIPVANSTP